MGIFNRKPIEEQNQNPISKLEEQKEEPEEEDEETICINCKHHSTEGDFDHNCYAESETNFVTGEKQSEDCEDKNQDGDCEDYEKKV